ncbi:Oxidative stress-induced growth inhibitor 2, partial [Mortierella alpina]
MHDFVQLTNHIQHQLAEAGRDANPVSALFDSLAHPYLDTHRGEYPSFLEWRLNDSSIPPAQCTDQKEQSPVHSPPPTPTLQAPAVLGPSTARPHLVLGRGDVGGIWADMEEDHNQTLSYNEHMELPLYSFTDFVHEHPEHCHNLDRPLRSTVSAYYKAYIRQTGIQSNFSNYTTVTGIYHLKDLKNHCCCSLDPQTPHSPGGARDGKAGRTKFLVRSKTVVLATGTFDKPKKLPAVSAHPCAPPACPAATIQQTFHDTRQLEEWMSKHNGSASSLRQESADSPSLSTASPPLSPAASSSPHLSDTSLSANLSSMLEGKSTLPIVIVGTGLSAADAILLIQEKQPWRRIVHIYKHFSASEPSPLKRCHRDVYPEYASVWVRMKKFATLKNSVQSYQRKEEGHCSIFGSSSSDGKSAMPCLDCKNLVPEELQSDHGPSQRCLGCSYKGLPDASVSSWNPLTGEIVIILSHGVVVKERVAAVGVFIGKQVHMGFLKGSLAQEMLSTGENGLGIGSSAGVSAMRRRMGGRRGSRSGRNRDSMVEIPTPPCTPPHSPLLRPRSHFRQRQKSVLEGSRGLGLANAGQDEEIRGEGAEDDGEARVEEGTGQDDDVVEQYQVLTLLRPLVSDMYNFRIIPTVVADDPAVAEAGTSATASSQLHSSSVAPSSVYPVKPKRCTRLPCYPVRTSSSASSLAASGGGSCGPETVCDTPDADAADADQKVEGETRTSKGFAARAMS